MSDILRELITIAGPYEEEYAYCLYRDGSDVSLREVLENKMENYKKKGVIKDYIIMQESFDVSPSLSIDYISISWITKDGELDGSVFHWEVY